jgi:hypothetical protein
MAVPPLGGNFWGTLEETGSFYCAVFYIPFAFYHPLSNIEHFILLPLNEGKRKAPMEFRVPPWSLRIQSFWEIHFINPPEV